MAKRWSSGSPDVSMVSLSPSNPNFRPSAFSSGSTEISLSIQPAGSVLASTVMSPLTLPAPNAAVNASIRRLRSASLASWPLTMTLPAVFSKPKRAFACATGAGGAGVVAAGGGGGGAGVSCLQLRNARNRPSRINSAISHLSQPGMPPAGACGVRAAVCGVGPISDANSAGMAVGIRPPGVSMAISLGRMAAPARLMVVAGTPSALAKRLISCWPKAALN